MPGTSIAFGIPTGVSAYLMLYAMGQIGIRDSTITHDKHEAIEALEDHDFTFANVQAILFALGNSLDLTEIPAQEFRDRIATAKAKRLIALTQGNVALETQAVSRSSAQSHFEKTKARIASSNRKLRAR